MRKGVRQSHLSPSISLVNIDNHVVPEREIDLIGAEDGYRGGAVEPAEAFDNPHLACKKTHPPRTLQ